MTKTLDNLEGETLSGAETIAETIGSDHLCITGLFQNKSVANFLFIFTFL